MRKTKKKTNENWKKISNMQTGMDQNGNVHHMPQVNNLLIQIRNDNDNKAKAEERKSGKQKEESKSKNNSFPNRKKKEFFSLHSGGFVMCKYVVGTFTLSRICKNKQNRRRIHTVTHTHTQRHS